MAGDSVLQSNTLDKPKWRSFAALARLTPHTLNFFPSDM